jgi:hypothetical protein
MYLGPGRMSNVINGALAIWHGPSCDRDFSLMQDIPASMYFALLQRLGFRVSAVRYFRGISDYEVKYKHPWEILVLSSTDGLNSA